MMFSLLTLLLLTLAAAKQDCPICTNTVWVAYSIYEMGDYIESNMEDFQDSCSIAKSSSNNSPCPDGKVCKVFHTFVGFRKKEGWYNLAMKEILCIHPSTSCLSTFSPYHRPFVDDCTESDLFSPEKCPGCMITQARISGVDYTVEDTCNYDSSQWHSCDRGVSCNFLTLTGRLTSTSSYSDTVTANIFGCGLDSSDCRAAEDALNTMPGLTISSCSDGEFSNFRLSSFIWNLFGRTTSFPM